MELLKHSTAKWFGLSLAIIILDQVTKQIAESSLQVYERIAIMPFFNLTLAYNEGAAFSFLADAGGWQRWFFVLLSATICVVLFIWLKRSQHKLEQLAISLVIGGAAGNLIDRLFFGKVIDFLDFYYDKHHWPAFNVADMAISGGVALLILATFFQPKVVGQNDKRD